MNGDLSLINTSTLKSMILTDAFQDYGRSKNLAMRLDESILDYKTPHTHNPTWTPTTMLSFRKSHCVNSKKMSRHIEGRTDLEPSSHGHRTKRTKRPVKSLFWHFLPKIYTNWSFKRKLIHNTLEYSWFSTLKQKLQKFNEMILRERQKASLHPFWAI